MDITHCLQTPSQKSVDGIVKCGGYRDLIPYMGKIAITLGVNGIFMEVHDNPDKALCDGPTQWRLDKLEWLLDFLLINKKNFLHTFNTDKITLHQYDKYYFQFFYHLLDKPIRLLEIGVEDGNSFLLWENLFKNAEFFVGIAYGKNNNQLNINKLKKTNIFYGDQSDTIFLNKIKDYFQEKKFDIIVDDGSHVPYHQFFTFETIFDSLLKEDGIYVIEDIETSYWNSTNPLPTIYGTYTIENGGIYNKGSLIEKLKNIPDVINRYFFNCNNYSIMKNNVDHLIKTITFSNNCIIISKKSNNLIQQKKNAYQHIDRYTNIKAIESLSNSQKLKLMQSKYLISGYSEIKKTCVIYNFFDNNGKDKLRRRNLKFFIDIGIRKKKNIYCYIIDRNEDNINLELPNNVKVMKYENIGICINGYKYGLNNIDIQKYDYFCFINDSMIGPFVPYNCNWIDCFASILEIGNSVAGSYEQNNTPQTGFFFVNKQSAIILLKFLNKYNIKSKYDALELEFKCIKHIMNVTKLPSKGTLPKGVRWTNEHNIFEVIFDKANRIGENKSIFWKTRTNQDINFITPDVLDEAIDICYKNISRV